LREPVHGDEPADHRRFIAEAGLPTWRRILGMLPLLLLVFTSPNFVLTLALLAWLWVRLVLDTDAHPLQAGGTGIRPRFPVAAAPDQLPGGRVIVLVSARMRLRRL